MKTIVSLIAPTYLVGDLYGKIRAGFKRILIFAPTGAGKTLVGSQVLSDAQSKGRKSLFLFYRHS
ncbi:DEAD/DEAH box helicase family protein [Chlorogloea sp. CCALA 695]|uniref:DEAD/DEAH box helicase family protein n=1 Tax=Chlorogloea sp. CCALA 695 TaxID=2107693 RepID=UPI000D07B69A|nr:DEAD/DEAH box helicase family protein [Chlorogloea sp. CCALA 695]PSB30821.1 hypothetical protein C7B70_15310 [Chlorogloea sp. CCALA 695]